MSFQSTLGEIDETGWLIIGIVGVIGLYELIQWAEQQAKNPGAAGAGIGNGIASFVNGVATPLGLGAPDPTNTTGNPNSVGDTSESAYAGNGIFGWLGNIFNKASGGTLQSLGDAIGNGAANLTCNFNPNMAATNCASCSSDAGN